MLCLHNVESSFGLTRQRKNLYWVQKAQKQWLNIEIRTGERKLDNERISPFFQSYSTKEPGSSDTAVRYYTGTPLSGARASFTNVHNGQSSKQIKI